MPKSYPINVEHLSFPTKTKAVEHFARMLRSGEIIDADLDAILRNHPEAGEKIGVGVDHFYIDDDSYGYRCFWLKRIDGTCTDFSFRSCLTPRSAVQQAKQAFRYAIRPQIALFRDIAFAGRNTAPSAMSGILVTREDAHVDHVAPHTFDALLTEFCESQDIALENVAVNATADGDTTTRLMDEQLETNWCNFHRSNAKLRLLHKSENLRLARKPHESRGKQPCDSLCLPNDVR